MIQILEPRESFGEIVGRGLGGGFSSGVDMRMKSNAEQEAEKRKFSQQLGLQRDKAAYEQQAQEGKFEQQMFLEQLKNQGQLANQKELAILKHQQEQESQGLKNQEESRGKSQSLMNALNTVHRMREIGARGHLGRGSSALGFFGGETSKDIGEYEQLGKSLIALASKVQIRNQIEFNTLAESLFDSSLPDAQREGVLDAMEKLIKDSISETQGRGSMESSPSEGLGNMILGEEVSPKEKKTRRPLSTFGG